MAARDRIVGDRELLHDGHLIQYSTHLPNFAGTLPYFDQVFTFYCDVSQTSWSLRVNFRITPADGSVSSDVTIRRTDDSLIVLDAEFWMIAFPDPLVQHPARSFRMRMPRGGEITRTFDGFIPHQALRQLGDRHLLFQVVFGVHGCHTEKDTERSAERYARKYGGNHGKKMLFSKL